jgi:hypothetical protein
MANEEHLAILKQGVEAWNKWRKDKPDARPNLKGANLEEANLEGVNLEFADLMRAKLNGATLIGADFFGADLRRAELSGAELSGADFMGANLEGVRLIKTVLIGASFRNANLENAWFLEVHLEGADFEDAKLNSTNFKGSYIQDANFLCADVNGETNFWKCKVNKSWRCDEHSCSVKHEQSRMHGTNFSGVGLGNVKIDPGTKQCLENNIRRYHWHVWCKKHRWLKGPVKGFWAMSDYGLSTWQIIKTFFCLASVFAAVYYFWGAMDYYLLSIKNGPGIVSNLFVLDSTGETVSWNQVPLRSFYFSIITMTTLGFGDMYANVSTGIEEAYAQLRSGLGHVLLMFQVLLGYVLLGALVTRFAVLFQAGGPAGEFIPMDKKTKDQLAEINKNATDMRPE